MAQIQGDRTIVSYNEAAKMNSSFVEGSCENGKKILIPLKDLGNMIPEGKILMDATFANGISFVHNDEYVFAILDQNQALLLGIKHDGTPVFPKTPVIM